MAQVQNASFIPKRTEQKPKRRRRIGRRIYLLSYVAYVFFFGGVLAALVVWLYEGQVSRQLVATEAELAELSQVFSADDIAAVKDFKKQLVVAEERLDGSVSLTKIFADIESFVSADITFTNFAYTRQPSGVVAVGLGGVATDFTEVIYQRNLMNQSPLFTDAMLVSYDYSLGTEDDGTSATNLIDQPVTIQFAYETEFDRGAIAYEPRRQTEVPPAVVEVRPGNEVETNPTAATSTPSAETP